MKQYVLGEMLHKVDPSHTGWEENGAKIVTLLTLEEFSHAIAGAAHHKAALRFFERSEYTRVELLGSCILGIVCIPEKGGTRAKPSRIGFCLIGNGLYLIGEEKLRERLFGRIRENQFPLETTLCGLLCRMLNLWIDEDAPYLQKTEDALSALEDALTQKLPRDFIQRLIPYRRGLMALQSYYYQLMSLGTALRSNINGMLTTEDCRSFDYFVNRVALLHSHVETLREYLLQIREMYQTQISLQQNAAMKLLTVVSTVFLPLTLLTGWYGMNFHNMPELAWKFGYPAICIVGVLIVVVEILYFKKKNLL